jgi:Holliday junction DNA helicase RuvB
MSSQNVNNFDKEFEFQLRPQFLKEFVGHEQLKEKLSVIIQAAKLRNEPLAHCLFHGPPGVGKTTLAHILSKEMQTNLHVTSGPAIEKAGDLAGILTNLQEGDVLFIDEIHALPRQIEEYLYPAIEDFSLDLLLDSGPSARSVKVNLNRFTLVGATTRAGQLSAPLRSRFPYLLKIDYYTVDALEEVIKRTGKILNLQFDSQSAKEIARRSRGTPRIANNLIRWVRDFAQIKNDAFADLITVKKALDMLAIDGKGLDEIDIKILKLIIEEYQGGPVGISAIASALGEESSTITEVYEPFLITQGFLRRTSRGREATSLAYEHLNYTAPTADRRI